VIILPTKHVAHIHPPSICGKRRLEPIGKDGILTFDHLTAQSLAGVIKFGHMTKTHPRNVVLLIISKVKISACFTLAVMECGLEPRMHHAAMIWDNIQNVAHVALC